MVGPGGDGVRTGSSYWTVLHSSYSRSHLRRHRLRGPVQAVTKACCYGSSVGRERRGSLPVSLVPNICVRACPVPPTFLSVLFVFADECW